MLAHLKYSLPYYAHVANREQLAIKVIIHFTI